MLVLSTKSKVDYFVTL